MKKFLISYWIQRRDDWQDLEVVVDSENAEKARLDFIDSKRSAKDIIVEEVEVIDGVVKKIKN